MQNNSPLLRVRDLKTYFFSREGTLKAVDGISFDIDRSETLGIAGESACGKSVTAQSILRIVPKNGRIVSGEIVLNLDGRFIDLVKLNPQGKEIRKIRGKEISMVFQEPMTSFTAVYTIGNQIMEIIRLHQNCTRKEARERAIDMLKKVGMPDSSKTIDAYPFNLSGGMRQRAMVAMALSCQPTLLIADEPTTAVDVTIQAQVLELVKELQRELNMALIIITHDLGVIAELADKVLIMYLGKGIEYASADEIFHNPKHPYTKGLLASIPKVTTKSEQRIKPIAGVVPSPYETLSGCKFYPRCPEYMTGICDKEEPFLVEVGKDHQVSCFLYSR